jgi:hypothetical protein
MCVCQSSAPGCCAAATPLFGAPEAPPTAGCSRPADALHGSCWKSSCCVLQRCRRVALQQVQLQPLLDAICSQRGQDVEAEVSVSLAACRRVQAAQQKRRDALLQRQVGCHRLLQRHKAVMQAGAHNAHVAQCMQLGVPRCRQGEVVASGWHELETGSRLTGAAGCSRTHPRPRGPAARLCRPPARAAGTALALRQRRRQRGPWDVPATAQYRRTLPPAALWHLWLQPAMRCQKQRPGSLAGLPPAARACATRCPPATPLPGLASQQRTAARTGAPREGSWPTGPPLQPTAAATARRALTALQAALTTAPSAGQPTSRRVVPASCGAERGQHSV